MIEHSSSGAYLPGLEEIMRGVVTDLAIDTDYRLAIETLDTLLQHGLGFYMNIKGSYLHNDGTRRCSGCELVIRDMRDKDRVHQIVYVGDNPGRCVRLGCAVMLNRIVQQAEQGGAS